MDLGFIPLRLTQIDLNYLIIRYNIPCDLHPRLPSLKLVMSELSDDAIGRAIPDYMSWRHPISAIDDPKPPAGSYSQDDVRRLSAHVEKLQDIPEGGLVLFGLSRVWKSQTRDLILKDLSGNVMGFLFYYTLLAAVDSVIPDPTSDDLDAGTPSAKVIPKAEASKKLKGLPETRAEALFLLVLKVIAPKGKAMIDATDASSRGDGHFRSSDGPAPSF
ncbi:hypothetical protein Tco_0570843 [Tanacetum coccineum]